MLKDGEGQQFLGVNRFKDVVWYNAEAFDELLWWLFLTAVIQSADDEIGGTYRVIRDIQRAGQKADYQVEKLLKAVKS